MVVLPQPPLGFSTRIRVGSSALRMRAAVLPTPPDCGGLRDGAADWPEARESGAGVGIGRVSPKPSAAHNTC